MKPSAGGQKGFTLMELLVAAAVLGLLLAMLLKISANTLEVTRFSRQNMEGMQRTRVALDALGADLRNLVGQQGITVLVRQDAQNNTEIAFLTRNRGPASATDCRCMAVAYRLNAEGKLVRYSVPVLWSSQDLLQDLAHAVVSGSGSTLADGVLRQEVVLMLDDGSIAPLSQNSSWMTSKINGDSLPTGLQGFSALVLSRLPVNASTPRVQGLTVGVAALESKAYRLPNSSGMGQLLVSPVTGETPFEVWSNAINNGSLAAFSKPAVAALHVSQTTFPLR